MTPEERIISWLGRDKKGPFSLEIRPTERCNLSCLSCIKHADFYEKSEKNKELTKEKYLKLIKDASELDIKKILISGGGEPFAREDLIDIMLKIKESRMHGEVITNGTLLNKDIIENLVKSSWDEIIISLDGPNSKINDYLRTKGFDAIIKNIRLINYFKKKYKTSRPELTIATVLSNRNYNLLFHMLKLCRKLNVRRFRLQELLIWSDNGKKLKLNSKQRRVFNSNLQNLIKYANKLKVETNLSDFVKIDSNRLSSNDDFYCFAPFFDLSIAEDGKVRYCQMAPKSYEDINDKPLKDIWFGKNMDSFRKKLLKGAFPKFCKNCCSPRLFQMKEMNELVKNKMRSK